MGGELVGPFSFGRGGPGGWWILDEPELRLGPPQPGVERSVVPDLAGWRRERLPVLPETSFFTLAPDWICEVLSPSTEAHDRLRKMPLYARAGVRHVWLIHPLRQTLEVFALDTDRLWKLLSVHGDAARVSAPPFGDIELDLSQLWAGGPVEGAPAPVAPKTLAAPAKRSAAAKKPKRRKS
jgi:Uma2 family endonuclease